MVSDNRWSLCYLIVGGLCKRPHYNQWDWANFRFVLKLEALSLLSVRFDLKITKNHMWRALTKHCIIYYAIEGWQLLCCAGVVDLCQQNWKRYDSGRTSRDPRQITLLCSTLMDIRTNKTQPGTFNWSTEHFSEFGNLCLVHTLQLKVFVRAIASFIRWHFLVSVKE